MLKKIYIFGLIFAFVFSTTGLSITQHICQMMDEVSAEQCGMCTETELPETMPCCEDGDSSGEIITSGNFSDCCDTQVIDNKVEDDFIYFKEEVTNYQSSSIIALPLSLFKNDNQIVKSFLHYAFDSSPPSRENDLYISNSVLLN